MRLKDYPRPPSDNGRGIHWSPSQYQWGKKDWDLWAQRLLDMKIKWVLCVSPPDNNANELAKRLIDLEIMPVVRFMGSKEPTVAGGAIMEKIAELVELGVSYFQLKNENDAAVERQRGIFETGWQRIDAQNIISEARRVISLGGIYCIYAYNTSLQQNAIQLIEQEGGRDVLEASALIVHNYGKGRPPNYPNDEVRMFGKHVEEFEYYSQGQPESWSDVQVKATVWKGLTREAVNNLRDGQGDPNITIYEDSTNFRMPEAWAKFYIDLGLNPPAIIGGEAGWEPEDAIDPWYPNPTAKKHSEYLVEAIEYMQATVPLKIFQPDGSYEIQDVPDYIVANTYWHMAEKQFGWDTGGQWEQGAWWTDWYNQKYELRGRLPIVDDIIALPTNVRHVGNVSPQWKVRQKLDPPDYVAEWDSRLKYLEVSINSVVTDEPAWRVMAGQWQDTTDLQILTAGYLFVKVLDETGQPIEGAEIKVYRPEGDRTVFDTIITKGRTDNYMANYALYAPMPTYNITVNRGDYQSDTIWGLGLGRESAISYERTSTLLTFVLSTDDEETPPTPEVCPCCGYPIPR